MAILTSFQNLLTCSVLKQYHRSTEITETNIEYNDIFSEDLHKQQKVTELFNQLLEERNKLMQSIPVACITGPVHGSPAVQNLV